MLPFLFLFSFIVSLFVGPSCYLSCAKLLLCSHHACITRASRFVLPLAHSVLPLHADRQRNTLRSWDSSRWAAWRPCDFAPSWTDADLLSETCYFVFIMSLSSKINATSMHRMGRSGPSLAVVVTTRPLHMMMRWWKKKWRNRSYKLYSVWLDLARRRTQRRRFYTHREPQQAKTRKRAKWWVLASIPHPSCII